MPVISLKRNETLKWKPGMFYVIVQRKIVYMLRSCQAFVEARQSPLKRRQPSCPQRLHHYQRKFVQVDYNKRDYSVILYIELDILKVLCQVIWVLKCQANSLDPNEMPFYLASLFRSELLTSETICSALPHCSVQYYIQLCWYSFKVNNYRNV